MQNLTFNSSWKVASFQPKLLFCKTHYLCFFAKVVLFRVLTICPNAHLCKIIKASYSFVASSLSLHTWAFFVENIFFMLLLGIFWQFYMEIVRQYVSLDTVGHVVGETFFIRTLFKNAPFIGVTSLEIFLVWP